MLERRRPHLLRDHPSAMGATLYVEVRLREVVRSERGRPTSPVNYQGKRSESAHARWAQRVVEESETRAGEGAGRSGPPARTRCPATRLGHLVSGRPEAMQR